jgi:hypothetical protein
MQVMKVTSAMATPPPASNESPQLVSRSWKPVMSTSMKARMAKMRMQVRMRRKKHPKPMMNQRRMWTTDMGTSNVDRYECEDGDNADIDAKEEPSQPDDGSTQNVED